MLGIILVNKPKGLTSHDVVHRARKALHTRRIGHAGTLDPLAEGLLVLAVGPATRFLQYLPLEPKEYSAVVRFGQETTTFDAEGEIVKELPVPYDLDQKLADLLPRFTGEIEQLPPMYSAVKKDGRPLYDYARKGEEVERKTRRIFIQSLEFEQTGSPTDRRMKVVCSGGTYIRTLGHDLGQEVGCGGTIIELLRTRVGKFGVEEAVDLDDLPNAVPVPLKEALAPMPMVTLNEGQEAYVRDGRAIKIKDELESEFAGLLDSAGDVIALAKVQGKELHPECVIPKSLEI
jgi:tRNA pseudouridine55 synthase